LNKKIIKNEDVAKIINEITKSEEKEPMIKLNNQKNKPKNIKDIDDVRIIRNNIVHRNNEQLKELEKNHKENIQQIGFYKHLFAKQEFILRKFVNKMEKRIKDNVLS
jgi:hypothetical protein